MAKRLFPATLRYGIVAGAAGGLAEVAWVALYCKVTGGDPAIIASGVTTATGLSPLLYVSASALGVAVHMMLAVALGTALALVWTARTANRNGATSPYPFMLAALVCVWVVNFFVVLPIIDPTFIHLSPNPVSLTSKLLFGLAAAEALRRLVASGPDLRKAFLAELPSTQGLISSDPQRPRPPCSRRSRL